MFEIRAELISFGIYSKTTGEKILNVLNKENAELVCAILNYDIKTEKNFLRSVEFDEFNLEKFRLT